MSKIRDHVSRRDFLKITAFTAAGTSIGLLPACVRSTVSRNTPLGVQLYSVRHELADDFRGTISKLAGMGYEGVEFADYFGMTATELRTILDDHNLRCCGSHVYLSELQDDAFEASVAIGKTLGNENFIIRWIPADERNSYDAFMRYIDQCNEVVDRLDPHGMRLGYHNHDYIFEKFDGESLLDILFRNTSERFMFQLDTGHAAGIGQDPVELLQRFPGRVPSIHAKAYSSVHREAVIGDDELDWTAIIRTTREISGIEWYILEYEIEGVPPLEALEASIVNFRTIKAGL